MLSMSRIGFWEGLFGDVGYYERMAINDNAESMQMMLDASTYGDEQAAQQLRRLFELDHAQSKELARLRTMVRVLAESLTELGLDRKKLEDQMERALDELESEKTMTEGAYGPGGPFRGGPAEAAPAPRTTTCAKCKKTVLLRRTNIGVHGTVCDRCHYGTSLSTEL